MGIEPDKINKEDGITGFEDASASREAKWTLDDLLYGFLNWVWSMFEGGGTPEEKLAAFKEGIDYVVAEASPLFMEAVNKSAGDGEVKPDARTAAMEKAAAIVRDVITKALAVSKAGDDEALQAALADLDKLADADTEAAVMEIAESVGVLTEKIAELAKGSGAPAETEPATTEKSETDKALDALSGRIEKLAKTVAGIGQTVAPSKVQKDTEPDNPEGVKDENWNILPKK